MLASRYIEEDIADGLVTLGGVAVVNGTVWSEGISNGDRGFGPEGTRFAYGDMTFVHKTGEICREMYEGETLAQAARRI